MNFRKLRESFTPLNNSLLVILITIAVATAAFSAPATSEDWWSGFWQNLSTELIGAILTYLLIEMFGKTLNVDAIEKRLLIRELGDMDNRVTARAIRDLWYRHWLQDGSVVGADLRYGNFDHNDLAVSDLRSVNFYRSNLRDARLWSDLRGANFYEADLTGAKLLLPEGVPHPPKGSPLPKVCQGTPPEKAILDNTTILPDGKKWTEVEGYDLARFTNPNHPEYWRSNNPNSPASPYYEGDNRQPASRHDVENILAKLNKIEARFG